MKERYLVGVRELRLVLLAPICVPPFTVAIHFPLHLLVILTT